MNGLHALAMIRVIRWSIPVRLFSPVVEQSVNVQARFMLELGSIRLAHRHAKAITTVSERPSRTSTRGSARRVSYFVPVRNLRRHAIFSLALATHRKTISTHEKSVGPKMETLVSSRAVSWLWQNR